MPRTDGDWRQIPSRRYFEESLRLTSDERSRLDAVLSVLADEIIDAHTHVARAEDIEALSDDILGAVVSTLPVFTFEMALQARRTLWAGKSVRSARMAHAVAGYRHDAVNRYIAEERPPGDLMVAFGRLNDQSDVEAQVRAGRASALKMYFRATIPPTMTVRDTFPDSMLEAARVGRVPIIVHLPTSLPLGVAEIQDVASAFPGLPIIVAHLGGQGGQPLMAGVREALAELALLPDVVLDTALILDEALVRAALETFGPERILFGTDEPLSLIRAVSYVHATLGPRLYGPQYHWADPRDADAAPTDQRPTLLHVRQLEAIVSACSAEPLTLRRIFHDNAARLMTRP